jgi:hypothetical protein
MRTTQLCTRRREAVEDGAKADKRIAELAEAVERFVKMDR